MNALCYKIVFSKRLGTLVAVGEHTAGQGKAAGTGVRTAVFPSSSAASADNFVGLLKAVFASITLSFVTVGVATAAGPAVNTLPTGYSVNSGNVAISSSATANNATMVIKQNTDKASINWQSFSIGSGAAVNVQQNSANSVLLNRVVGNDPSQIFGKLTANGQVILINPNGVVFGKGGSVTASAFTASTFGMTDADFQAGKHQFSRNGSTAGVTVEQGATINTTAPGGYVALLGASVNNQGEIHTQQGAVVMAAGESVALPTALTESVGVPLSSKVRLELAPSTINASVENGGTITTEGGQVLMQAAAVADAVASVTHTGTIDTTGVQGGAVTLLAEQGDIKVTGTIKANSTDTTNKGSDIIIGRDEVTGALAADTDVSGAKLESGRGFIETSGHHLAVDGAQVIAKDWLLDPDNIDITGDSTGATAGYSKIKASDIVTNLNNGTSVTVSTTASSRVNQPGYKNTAGTGAGTTVTGDGNILVNADIIKTTGGSTSLTLLADNGITLNKAIKSTSGALDVTLTANGNALNTANSQGIVMSGTSSIDANGGAVALNGTSKFPTGGFNKGGLYMYGNGGAYASIRGGSVTINATTSGTTSGTAYGMFVDQGTSITATAGDIKVTSKMTGAAAGNAVFTGSNVGPGITWSATGKIDIEGDLTGNANAAATAVYLGSLRINAGGDVNIKATTPNEGAAAIVMQKTNPGWAPGIKSGGDVTIRSNQGSIALNNFDAADTNTGLGITGRNITIDNTGGSVQNGVYAKGTGQSTSTSWSGVQVNTPPGLAATAVQASGELNIIGNSQTNSNNAGVNISAGIKGATVTVDGRSKAGNGIYSGQTIESTAGDVKITGVSNTSSALSLQGAITASNNLEITGTNIDSNNASPVAYLTKAVTASNGTIRITADTAGSATQALNLNGATLTTSGKDITLTSDSMNIGGKVNAGAGTVTLQNKRDGVLIDIGSGTGTSGVDIGNTVVNQRTLGINSSKLLQITAAKTVIGSSTAGKLTISSAITTPDQARNIALISGDEIAVNSALKVGGSGTINLSMTAGKAITNGTNGSINAAVLRIKAGTTIGSSSANLQTKVGSLFMESAGNQYVTEADGVTVAATSSNGTVNVSTTNGTFTVYTGQGVDGTALTGINAKGDINLTANTSTGSALDIQRAVVSQGNVTLTGTTSDTNNNSDAAIMSSALVKGNNITMTATATGTTGKTLGYRGMGDGGQFVAAGDLTLTGTSKNDGNGFYMWGGKLSSDKALSITGVSTNGQGIGFEKAGTTASNIVIASGNGVTMTGSAKEGKEAIGFNDVTLTNTTGAVKLEALNQGKIVANSTNTLTQNGDGGVTLTTVGNGNITVPKIINNGTGNVVIAAGSDLPAGNGDGGQVLTVSGNTISQGNATPGKTYIYSGSAAGTSALTNIDSTNFSALNVNGTATQNADTNVAYNSASLGIAGSTAPAQVMFREKITIANNGLGGATVNKTYGDASTANTVAAAGDLLAEAKTALKGTNSGSYTISNNSGNNTIVIDKVVVIDSMTGSLSEPTYNSTNTYLKATSHNYGDLSSSKYTTQNIAANQVKVVVAQKALTGVIGSGSSTYGDALNLGTAGALGGKVGNDDVVAGAAKVELTALNTSTGGKLKAGSHTQTLTGLTGADAANYTFADVTGDYKVEQKSLTALYAANNKVFDGNTTALVTASLQDANQNVGVIARDDVKAIHTSANFDSPDVGTGKTITVKGISLTGDDAANYKVSPTNNPGNTAKTTANITPVPPTPPSPVVPSGTTARVKIPVGSSNPFALASAEDLADDTCTANSIENCYCEESTSSQGVDICYEPKAGAKGSVR